jgi:hypothetical protein
MPTARAIRCKSGLAPANTLRAFRFYPYCISLRSSNTHCAGHTCQRKNQSPPISAAAQSSCE